MVLFGNFFFNFFNKCSNVFSILCMKRISAAECYTGNIFFFKFVKNLFLCSLTNSNRRLYPTLRVLTIRTMMFATGNPQYNTKSVTVKHIIFCYIMITHYILFLSAISAIFALLSLVSPLTLEYDK